jgi:hypothetical protein
MSTQLLAAMLTIFVLGLFFGTNLGIALVCVMQMAGRHADPKPELAPVVVHVESED